MTGDDKWKAPPPSNRLIDLNLQVGAFDNELILILVDALMTALNTEGSATLGAEIEAKANPTYAPMDVPYHYNKIREALALARRAGFEPS